MKKEIIEDEKNNIINKSKNIKYEDGDYDRDDYNDIGCEYYGASSDILQDRRLELQSIYKKANVIKMNAENMNKVLQNQGSHLDCIEDYIEAKCSSLENDSYNYKSSSKKSSFGSITGFFKSIGSSIKGIFSKNNTNSNKNIREDNKIKNEVNNEIKDENKNKSIDNNNIKNEIKEENKEKIKEINIKDLINDQNFLEGY